VACGACIYQTQGVLAPHNPQPLTMCTRACVCLCACQEGAASKEIQQEARDNAMEAASEEIQHREVQGCDADCDFNCQLCPWEKCVLIKCNGGTCDVMIVEDEELLCNIPNRFIRQVQHVNASRTRNRGGNASRTRNKVAKLH